MARRADAPATLTAHHDCEFREVLDRVGDKWSLLVIASTIFGFPVNFSTPDSPISSAGIQVARS